MFASVAVLVSLAASAMAKPYLTSPVAGSVCSGGSICNVNWQDDNNTPSLNDFGDAKVGIYVGNVNQQTMVQSISDSVNVATTSSIAFTVDPNAGPDDDIYFIRFDSINGMNGSTPFQAFSAKFTLKNMSGQFNSTVQAQINAADGAGPSSNAPASATDSSSSLTTKVASSASKATGSNTASPSASGSSGSAASSASRAGVAGGLLGAFGCFAALLGLAI
ncbi:uncharacterized protein FOMMEDRAFT_123808 [Fomitiporia mediterranea MF3/22]|uniref:uncharacterized protein n=1 Tax=Fomitiporia mediterranea (strain MF3/22) TaxID=694068 RepID=UPI0004409933|nr:uncharacterized protein FOMMEDRAFT_123808 [Fomitiporia mediterranea MF3/22]EJD01784.1 hypothetical protein FOMMEDRAFT_123808 [Fomitiporia mediterranea MF3/22]